MSHFGIIYVGYQCEDYLPRSLSPWVEARAQHLNGHTFSICAVSVPFVGFDMGNEPRDHTRELLDIELGTRRIDNLICGDSPRRETDARGAALRWLVNEAKVDITVMVDSDEMWTIDEISRMVAFTEDNLLVAWFRVALKNLVFDTSHYLANPFTPPRVHRVNVGGNGFSKAYAHGFWDDNNVLYNRGMLRDFVRDTDLPSMTIPATACNPLHYSWLNDLRSKRKIDYQVRGRSWPSCSFAWDDSKGGLIWNEAHFAAQGLPLPQVLSLPA